MNKLALLLFLINASVHAAPLVTPHVFTTGTPAIASEVNDNFQAHANAINNLMSASVPWLVVNGTSQQASVNTGYIVTGAELTNITLPSDPLPGNIVKVTSPGTGGYLIVPTSGQIITGSNAPLVARGNIYTSTDSGVTWILRDSSRTWQSVASSSDGTKLVAIVKAGQIYTSTDSGVTWISRDSNRAWQSVASSSDGTKLVAVVDAGQIFTSTDNGVTWTPRDSNRAWQSVASSSDGTKLVAVVDAGQIYTSTDSGVTWLPRFGSSEPWRVVASSADGNKLMASLDWGYSYSSVDAGANWSVNPPFQGNAIAFSSDASIQILVNSVFNVSINSGTSWNQYGNNSEYLSVAASSDGTRLIAGSSNAYNESALYISIDSGQTWNVCFSSTNANWQGVASSANGNKLVAVTNAGVGTNISGGQFSSVELVYVGSGQWTIVSNQGAVFQ